MEIFQLHRGTSPVILAFPHVGTYEPPDIWEKLNDNGHMLADTDWHVDRLYDGLLPGASTIRATSVEYIEERLYSGAVVKPTWLFTMTCTVPPVR